jgi:hypothetical protein
MVLIVIAPHTTQDTTMLRQRTLVPLIAVLLLTGCARVAPQAVSLTSSVDLAIRRLQTQTETIIQAAASQQRAQLDEAWPTLYAQAESAFVEAKTLSPDANLTHQQRATIAAIAAEAHDAIRLRIDAAQRQLVADTRRNTQQALAINNTVREHLLTLTSIDSAQQSALDSLESITDVPTRQHWNELISILAPTTPNTETSP